MNIKFDKPEFKIVEYMDNNHYGKFVLEPLERGFGTTIGNALRRVMLSSLPGTAITSVKIDGVMHEFQKLDGVVEDVTAIILALKSIVLKNHADEDKVIRLSASKEGPVTAGDIETDADIEIINKDLVICNLVKGGKIDAKMTVSNGRGYVDSKENKQLLENPEIGTIPIDSLYSPIERVAYEVEPARVGQNENFDKLVMEVYTNGATTPEEAMALAAKILIEHFNIITDLNSISDFSGMMAEKKIDVHTVQDLISMKEVEVTKIRNLGKKSLKEVIDKVKELGLEFHE